MISVNELLCDNCGKNLFIIINSLDTRRDEVTQQFKCFTCGKIVHQETW